ncbi:hypothetical protein EYF80_015839 [Liparis tanakae]|uniref:Uncharacterized protein n=1 Tax=Liparis tanakae TaxID=230148 RepID=A0A4Z2I8W1_9TELE|nr:hypothetical protein EYF80_015839 [Liparis tanakae]
MSVVSSREGLCFCASAGLLRFTPIFLSLRAPGWERLRARPPRRSSSGVESGELAGEGRQICSGCAEGSEEEEEEEGVRPAKAEEGQGSGRPKQGRLKLALRCMAGKPSCGALAARPRCTLPPLWHRLFSTAVHTREPWGRQVERQPPSSSEQDRERHCRLLGGAAECEAAAAAAAAASASVRLRSRNKLVMAVEVEAASQSQWAELLCTSGRTSHRLSRLVPTGLCCAAQL